MRWDVDLAAAGEMGLYESLRGLYPDMHREFAAYMQDATIRRGCKNLEGDRPPLSIDIVGEFLLPMLQRDTRRGVHRRRLPAARSVARPRAAARAVLRRRDDALLRGASDGDAVLAQRAVQRALSRARSRRASRLVGQRSRGRVAQRARARAARGAPRGAERPDAGALPEDLDRRRLRRARAPPRHRDRPRRRERVRLQLRRPADARAQRIADPVRSRARRDRAPAAHAAVVPALGAAQRAQGSVAPEDLGAAHERSRLDPLQHAGDGVRQARRDARTCATSSARTCAPSARSRRCCSRTRTICGCRGAGSGGNTLLATNDASSSIRRSCASTRAATAGRSCTVA